MWVPASAVYFPFTSPPLLHEQSTTGLATGASPTEACVYALLEVIERDALTFSSWLRRGRPLRLDTITEPRLAALVERLGRQGVEVRVWLIESAFAVPTFFAVLDDTWRASPMYISAGTGCHLDPHAAARIAILEALFCRVSVLAGGREDLAEHSAAFERLSYAQLRAEAQLWRGEGSVGLSDIEDRSTPTLRGDLDVLLDELDRKGVGPVLVADLSARDLSFSVVRCVVPGMECTFNGKRVGPRLQRELEAFGPALVAAAAP
jgi:ribosomal protein S12 methylthiotransferase accessory factor